jgi:uncharacterized membrane protein YfcA
MMGCSFLGMLTLTVAQMNLLAGLGGIALIIATIGMFFADRKEKEDKRRAAWMKKARNDAGLPPE